MSTTDYRDEIISGLNKRIQGYIASQKSDFQMYAEELDSLQRRVEELENDISDSVLLEIYDKLPRTADGKVFVPMVDPVWHLAVTFQGGMKTIKPLRLVTYSLAVAAKCYSTQEAAEQAIQGVEFIDLNHDPDTCRKYGKETP